MTEETNSNNIPFEMPILRTAIKEVIDNEPDMLRLRMIASMVLDLGKESPVMQQLQIHMMESEEEYKAQNKDIELVAEDIKALKEEITKFPKWLRNEKINTMIKIGLGIGISLGVTQIPDVLQLIGF
jgi:NACalpha-BTF3-like transcription factor